MYKHLLGASCFININSSFYLDFQKNRVGSPENQKINFFSLMNEKYLTMAENGRCYFLYANFCIIYVFCIELFSCAKRFSLDLNSVKIL